MRKSASFGRRKNINLRPSDQFLFVCLWRHGILCSFLRDVAGNHAETHTGAKIYYGDAASFHEWEFRTGLRIAGKTGDALVGAQEVGFDNLCETVDGIPHKVSTC